jgi:hypothetical protein
MEYGVWSKGWNRGLLGGGPCLMIEESRLRVRIIWGRNGDARRSGGNKEAL